MTNTLPTLRLEDLEPSFADIQQGCERTIDLILEQIGTKQKRLETLLGGFLSEVSGKRGNGLLPIKVQDYRHLMGNLTAMSLELTEDEEVSEKIAGAIRAMCDGTSGIRQQYWNRIQSILTFRSDEQSREESSVATMDKRRSASKKRVSAKRLNAIQELLSIAYPTGIDALNPDQEDGIVSTLNAQEPIVISFGEGGSRNEVLLTPHRRRAETTATWVQDDGIMGVEQCIIPDDASMIIGPTEEINSLFGAGLRHPVMAPRHVTLGDNGIASVLLGVRWKDRIALFLKRCRGEFTVTQGNDIWRYDPMAATEDTFGVTQKITEVEDTEDDVDTVLE